MQRKKLSLWWKSALVVLSFSLVTACSSGEDENADTEPAEEESGTNDSEDGESSSEEGTDDLAGDFEIQYFVGGYGDEWWKEVIGDFQAEHPDLNITEHAGPNINEEMRTRWISEDPPDVVYIDGAGSSETQMVEDGQLMDITEWAEEIELEDGSSLMDNFIVEPNRYDGNLFSLPLVFDTWGTWYDKAWFDENDWEVPTDFDHFMEVMGEIQAEEDIAPFVTTGQYPYYFLRGVLNPAFGSAGGDDLLADLVSGKEGAWSSEETLNVMKKVEKMAAAGYIDSGYAALNHTQSQMNFLLHENAFIPVGFWLPNEMENDKPEDVEYGFTPSPFQDEGEPYVVVPDLRPLAIAENAENPEAAKAFVEFVFKRERAQSFSEYTGAIMNVSGVDLTENPDVPEYLQTANEMINDPNQVSIHSLPYPMSADLEEPISDALVALMSGDITAEEFTQRAEAAAADYRD